MNNIISILEYHSHPSPDKLQMFIMPKRERKSFTMRTDGEDLSAMSVEAAVLL